MKRIVLLLVSIIICLPFFAKDGFVLTGKIEGLPSGTVLQLIPINVYLQSPMFETVTTDGNFRFEGQVEEPTCMYLLVKESFSPTYIMLDNNTKATIKARAEVVDNPKTGRSVSLKDFKVKGSKLTDQMNAILGTRGFDTPEDERERLVNANKNNMWGPILMMQMQYSNTFQRDQFERFSEEAKNTPAGRAIHDYLYPDTMKIGEVIKPFSLKDEQGNVTEILDLVKKSRYTLIDFWASWCVPCRQEMQNVKRYYAKWKDEGFNVVSISVDRKEGDWKKACTEEQIQWDSYLDRMGAADKYQIMYVPALYVVDREGKLIAINPREERLQNLLEDLFRKPSTYKIDGVMPDEFNGKEVGLSKGFLGPKIDSVLVRNGKFHMEGSLPRPEICNFLINNQIAGLVAVDGSDVTMQMVNDKPVFTGGRHNELLTRYENEVQGQLSAHSNSMPRNTGIKNLSAKSNQKQTQDAANLRNQMIDNYRKSLQRFVAENTDNMVGGYVYGLFGESMLTQAFCDSILNVASKEFKTYPLAAARMRDNNKTLKASTRRNPGQPLTDFSMPDTEGVVHKMSEEIAKHKLTLIDFWASWCGPCRAEIPYVKKTYDAYRDKGFYVVSVSLDSNKNAWLKAIESHQLSWLQLSDLKGWKCEAAALYGITGIPATLLVSQDGTIVASDLRGEDLMKKVGYYLDK